MIKLKDILTENLSVTFELKDLGDDDFKVIAASGSNSVGTLTFTKSKNILSVLTYFC